MEKLTKTYSDGTHGASDSLPCGENSYDYKNLLIEKLGKYEDLEEQGRLIKLPCKVGDTIWDNDFGRTVGFEVTGFSFGDMNEDYCDDEVKVFNQIIVYYKNSNGSITGSFAVSEIGKNVFLTQEEAEKKLKETKTRNGITE